MATTTATAEATGRAADAPVSKPETRKWVGTCGHSKSIIVGSMEYEDATANGWSYCNRNGCKDTIAGQWADAPRKGEIVNGKVKTTRKAAAAAKPAAKAAKKSKATGASRTRKAADSLPNRVRAQREAAALSPKELAAQIGGDWTASTVRRIERGARQATPEQIAQLADTLAVPVADLGFAPAAESKAAAPAKAAKKPAAAKVVGKRTGKVLASKADVKEEIGAILGA